MRDFDEDEIPERRRKERNDLKKISHFANVSCRKKKRFHDAEQAKYCIKRAEHACRLNGCEPTPQRIYFCNLCKGYHTTSLAASDK